MDGIQTMLTGTHEVFPYYIVITSLERSNALCFCPEQLSSNVPEIEEFGGNA